VGIVIKRSLGERTRKIALRRGIPFVTVETVIRDYLESLIVDAENRERIVIDGITSVTIVQDLNTGELYPRGRVSPALKSRLLKKGVVLETVEQA
jgi:hypothetical protein